jgi:pimeloyl-ACP methyl ester carboxylesterase
MASLRSPFKSTKGEAEYMAAYERGMGLWPVAYEHMDVPGRYGRTHVVATGPEGAPALVLLHADYVSSTMWAANVSDLSRDHRLYAVDVMGQPGKSVPDQPIRNRDDAVAWITEVLGGLNLTRVTLVGMSYGGWLTLNYAIRAPKRLERIVVLSPGACFRPNRPSFYLRVLPAMILPFLPRRVLFERSWRAFSFEENLSDPVVHALNERVGQQMYLGFRYFRVWGNWGSQNLKPQVFPDHELNGMHVPTLLLIGQQEVLYDPVAALERARRLIPNLDGELVPRASHDMTQGQHQIVNARILEFLNLTR